MMYDKIKNLLKLSSRTKGQRSENLLSSLRYANNLTLKMSEEMPAQKKQPSFFQSLLRLSHTSPHARSPLNYRACCKGMESKAGLIASICITCGNNNNNNKR